MTNHHDAPAHPAFERLADFRDGELAPAAARDVAAHVEGCAECARIVASLDALGAQASRAAGDVTPPADLWPAIRADIAGRAVGGAMDSSAGVASRSPSTAPWWRGSRPMLAAASLLLVAALSSAATIAVMGGRDHVGATTAAASTGDGSATAPDAPDARPSDREALLRYVALERGYDRTAADLRAQLDAQRTRLAPETVATVERSLRTIDGAIAEARAALARDPGNDALVEMLTATQEQRLDLLRRATRIRSEA